MPANNPAPLLCEVLAGTVLSSVFGSGTSLQHAHRLFFVWLVCGEKILRMRWHRWASVQIDGGRANFEIVGSK